MDEKFSAMETGHLILDNGSLIVSYVKKFKLKDLVLRIDSLSTLLETKLYINLKTQKIKLSIQSSLLIFTT